MKIVLGYDLGGTKIAVGVVNEKGKILKKTTEPVLSGQGKEAVLAQLATLGKNLISEFPRISSIGIASAGPLDPRKGILLDPTNLTTDGQGWGTVRISQVLERKLKKKVFLDNDAAAAILAERWLGVARRYENAMILTLGTGLGVGVIANGKLVRSGRGLHPEAGHIIVRHGDQSAPCGCGNHGCMEALLSGSGFGRRVAARLGDGRLKASEIIAMARNGNAIALEGLDEYAGLMASALYSYIRLYSPEIIVFTGSFAAAYDLFITKTQTRLETMASRLREGIDMMPKLSLSKLDNTAGIVGGAYIGLNGLKGY